MVTSYSIKPKPHLIVGNWELIENQKSQQFLSKDQKNYTIERLFFSSDEITAGFILIEKGKKGEQKENVAFKIYEPFDNFKTTMLLFKNICDDKTRMVFSIITLDKGVLKLKFEKEFSSDNIAITNEILIFERTAGPTENIPDTKEAIKMTLELDKKK